MKLKTAVLDAISTQGILPLFYHNDGQISLETVKTLHRAGITAIEYTNRGPYALQNFKLLKQNAGHLPGLLLGIGTIKTKDEALLFIDAGADFVVSPVVNPDVAAAVHRHNLLWIPGCMTPTEIHRSEELGARLVKIFPANVTGPAFISALKDIFPEMLFMPTGGVEPEPGNLKSWFSAGVCAVGIGSKLIGTDVLENKEYDVLYVNTLRIIALVKSIL